jgi:hypothetical protein
MASQTAQMDALVWHGDQYVLREIRTASGVHELPKSRTEIKLTDMQKPESVSLGQL